MNQKISTKNLSSQERTVFWRTKVEEYRGSNESLVGFCKREKLCISPMRVWVRKFYPSEVARAKSVKNTNFIPVTVQELKKDIHFTDQQLTILSYKIDPLKERLMLSNVHAKARRLVFRTMYYIDYIILKSANVNQNNLVIKA